MPLDIPLRKRNKGQERLFFFGQKTWSRIDLVTKMLNKVFFMHALKKNILLHLQTLTISNNYPIFMVNIVINCLIIFPFHFIICIRFTRSS